MLGVGRYRDDVHLVRALAEAGLDVGALVLVATPMYAFREDLGTLAEGCIGPSQWEPHAQGRPDIRPFLFGLVRIRHQRALEITARARRLRDFIPKQAAGAALGRGKRLFPFR
jgi:hypothetical protein